MLAAEKCRRGPPDIFGAIIEGRQPPMHDRQAVARSHPGSRSGFRANIASAVSTSALPCFGMRIISQQARGQQIAPDAETAGERSRLRIVDDGGAHDARASFSGCSPLPPIEASKLVKPVIRPSRECLHEVGRDRQRSHAPGTSTARGLRMAQSIWIDRSRHLWIRQRRCNSLSPRYELSVSALPM
jgi:hypothetical protein